MKFMQDYNFKVSGNKTNTIQFSIDVLNIGNFLLILIGSSSSSYKCAANFSVDPTTKVPTYTFNGTQTKTFITMLVCCQDGKQFGLRYIF
jgi:hypothetical protein